MPCKRSILDHTMQTPFDGVYLNVKGDKASLYRRLMIIQLWIISTYVRLLTQRTYLWTFCSGSLLTTLNREMFCSFISADTAVRFVAFVSIDWHFPEQLHIIKAFRNLWRVTVLVEGMKFFYVWACFSYDIWEICKFELVACSAYVRLPRIVLWKWPQMESWRCSRVVGL